tara:strand:- start:1959 stop:2600 length:642 start_codon:yes stop_codon:yes gene_type:complete
MGAPIDEAIKYLRKSTELDGSTGARLYDTPHGKVVGKRGAHDAHIQNEYDFNQYMNALGVPVPDARMEDGTMFTEYEGDKRLGYDVSEKDLSQLARDFVPHAVAANWDMIGMDADNAVRRPDGTLSYVDLGGAGPFRAQGAPKGQAFGSQVGEIDTMRQQNPYFLTMPEHAVGQSYDHYGGSDAMTDALEHIRDRQTRDTLQQRIEDVSRRVA